LKEREIKEKNVFSGLFLEKVKLPKHILYRGHCLKFSVQNGGIDFYGQPEMRANTF
jgi:hypothetical protein